MPTPLVENAKRECNFSAYSFAWATPSVSERLVFHQFNTHTCLFGSWANSERFVQRSKGKGRGKTEQKGQRGMPGTYTLYTSDNMDLPDVIVVYTEWYMVVKPNGFLLL